MSQRGFQQIVCMGDGYQDDGLNAIPRYFDFQREVIDGSFLDISINRFLIKLLFKHVSNESLKPWSALTQVDFINFIEHSFRYHQMLNAQIVTQAISTGRVPEIKSAKDADILEYMMESLRMVTPNDVELRQEPVSMKFMVDRRLSKNN